MILAIDAGNSNITFGCMRGSEIVFTALISTDLKKTSDEYRMLFVSFLKMYKVSLYELDGGIISSVVPMLCNVLREAAEIIIGKRPLVVGPGMKTGFQIRIDNPAQLGSDLVVGAVAACALYQKPILIFDMGTATTLSVIDAAGNYIGGMIIPGLRVAVDALTSNTSQLPNISLDAPEQLIGTNTICCMKSGAIYGSAAMIDGLIDRVEEQLEQKLTVVATGGIISCVGEYCKHKIIRNDHLMLIGLQLLYEKNKISK